MKINIESRALKYGFSNARAKAIKGSLLKAAAFDEMIKVPTIDGMVELMQRTGYRDDLVAASIDHSGSELVEMAGSRSFMRMVAKLLRFTPRDDVPAVKALLRKWDIMNLKTIVMAKRLNKSYKEIKPYLFPIGGFREEDFERIANADKDQLFNEIRRTEVGSEMLSVSTASFSRQMWDTFRNALKNLDTFVQLTTILDAYTYLFMHKALSQAKGKDINLIRRLLEREIDARNILIIERLKAYKLPPEKIQNYLIRGGSLNAGFIRSLMEAKDLSTAVALAKSKFHKLELKEGAVRLSDLEIALEKAIAAQKSLAFHRSMLSIGAVLGILLLKEEEINNLRKIAKGKEFGMSEKDVKDMLVTV